jgi:hypothetical protein
VKLIALILVLGFGLGSLAALLGRHEASRRRSPVDAAITQELPNPVELKSDGQLSLKPLTWAYVSRENLTDSIECLRGVGCPEDTIFQIMFCEVSALRVSNSAAMPFSPNLIERNRQAARAALRRSTEIREFVVEKLGLRPTPMPSAYFSSAQELDLENAWKQFPGVRIDAANPLTSSAAESNKVARISLVATVLTADQLELYLLDREKEALEIASVLFGLQPTKAEFIGVHQALAGNHASFRNGSFTGDTGAILAGVLGSQRFDRLIQLHRPEYRAIRIFGAFNRLTDSEVVALMNLRLAFPGKLSPDYVQKVSEVLEKHSLISSFLSDAKIHSVGEAGG